METNVNSEKASKIQKLFNDYEKSHEKKSFGENREDKLKKYFKPRNSKETFRMLPPKDNRDYVEFAYFHSVQTNSTGGKKRWRKFYCPAHNDPKIPKVVNGEIVRDQTTNEPIMVAPPCSLCEKHNKILKTQNPSLKGVKKEAMTEDQKRIKADNDKIYKDSLKWKADKYYLVRGIDKGQPKDGVKFWRFKHNYKKQGIYDKLKPALQQFYEEHGDFTDIEKGADLNITVVDNQFPGSDRTFRDVSSIMTRQPSKLYDDPNVVQEWLNDDITWRDVFLPPKTRVLDTFEYLDRVAKGTDPYWDDSDTENKRWVFPDPNDAELQVKANTRDQNLDAEKPKDTYDVASDLINNSYKPDINTITKEDVGEFKDDALDVSQEVTNKIPKTETVVETKQEELVTAGDDAIEGDDEYDDLPF